MLRDFGSERLIGMLHAFLLLKPVISRSLRKKEKALIVDSKLIDDESPVQLNLNDQLNL